MGTRIVASTPTDWYVLNAADGKVIATLQVSREIWSSHHLRFSPDGHLVLVSKAYLNGDAGPIVVFDADRKEIEMFRQLPIRVWRAEWSPDGKRILAGCMDACGTITVLRRSYEEPHASVHGETSRKRTVQGNKFLVFR